MIPTKAAVSIGALESGNSLLTKQSFVPTPFYVFLMFMSLSLSLLCTWDYFNSGMYANLYGIGGGIVLSFLISWLVRRKVVFFYHNRVVIRSIFNSHSIPNSDLVVIWIHATELFINNISTNNRTYTLEFLPKDVGSITFRVCFAGQATHSTIQRGLDHIRKSNPKIRILFPNSQQACQVCGASVFPSISVCNKCKTD